MTLKSSVVCVARLHRRRGCSGLPGQIRRTPVLRRPIWTARGQLNAILRLRRRVCWCAAATCCRPRQYRTHIKRHVNHHQHEAGRHVGGERTQPLRQRCTYRCDNIKAASLKSAFCRRRRPIPGRRFDTRREQRGSMGPETNALD